MSPGPLARLLGRGTVTVPTPVAPPMVGPSGPDPAPDPAERQPRDSQRIRVYRAETPLAGRRFAELDRCRAYCEEVVGSLWWLDRFPDIGLGDIPILRDGRGARQAFYREDPGHPTITLPRRYRTSGVILHELAHWIMRADVDLPNHGRTFTRLLLDLTGEFAGPGARDRLADAYTEHAVKVGEPPRRGPDGRWRYGIDERLVVLRGSDVEVRHGDDVDGVPLRGVLVSATKRRVTIGREDGETVVAPATIWALRRT